MKLTACNENNTLFSDKSQVIITKNRGIATKHLYPMEFSMCRGAEGLLIPASCLEYTKLSVFTPQTV